MAGLASHRHGEWTSADHEEIAAIEMRVDRVPGIGGKRRTVGEHQEISRRQHARARQFREIVEDGSERLQRVFQHLSRGEFRLGRWKTFVPKYNRTRGQRPGERE